MANGDGSIIAKGRGVWEVQVSFGRNPVTGRYERATRTVHGTKKDAVKVRDELRRQHDSGVKVDGAKMLFKDLASAWLAARRVSGAVGNDTVRGNERILEHLCMTFGGRRICDITPAAVEGYYAALKTGEASISGKPLSGSRILQYHRCFRQVMQRAVEHDYLVRNPCDRAAKPSVGRSDRRSLCAGDGYRLKCVIDDEFDRACAEYADKERAALISGRTDTRRYSRGLAEISCVILVRIALATGMRRGEIIALTWQDVDLKRGELKITRSRTSRGEIKEPKTAAGTRCIAIDAHTVGMLSTWKAFEMDALRNIGVEAEIAIMPVCCSGTGDYLDANHLGRWWRRWREDNGFSGLKLHELRHTQATQLLGHGVDIKTVQARLGHAKASITLDMYSHALPENDRKAADLFETILDAEAGKVVEIKAAS